MIARILRAAVEGGDRAYRDFLRKAADLIRAWARRRTLGGLHPEDIVQETLLAIHVKRHTWRSDGPVARGFMRSPGTSLSMLYGGRAATLGSMAFSD